MIVGSAPIATGILIAISSHTTDRNAAKPSRIVANQAGPRSAIGAVHAHDQARALVWKGSTWPRRCSA
jgi:hypothetical protein